MFVFIMKLKGETGPLLRRQFRVILLCLGPLVLHQPGSSSPLLKVFRSHDCISLATVRWTVFDVEMIRSVPLRSDILFRSFICNTTVTSLVLIVPWQDWHFVLVFLQYVSHLAFTGPWSTRDFLAGGLICSFSTKHNGTLRPDKIKDKTMSKQKGAFRPNIIKLSKVLVFVPTTIKENGA